MKRDFRRNNKLYYFFRICLASTAFFLSIIICMNFHNLLHITKYRGTVTVILSVIFLFLAGLNRREGLTIPKCILPYLICIILSAFTAYIFNSNRFVIESGLCLLSTLILLYGKLDKDTVLRFAVVSECIGFAFYFIIRQTAFMSSNSFGILFSGLCILIINYLDYSDKLYSKLGVIVQIVLITLLFFTQSRTALFSIIMITIINLIREYTKSRDNGRGKAIIVIIFLLTISVILEILFGLYGKLWIIIQKTFFSKWGSTYSTINLDLLTSSRTIKWRDALDRIKILGNGEYDYEIYNTHNVFVQMLDTYGIIVGVMFIVSIITIFVSIRKVKGTRQYWVYLEFFIFWSMVAFFENIIPIGGRMYIISFNFTLYLSMLSNDLLQERITEY